MMDKMTSELLKTELFDFLISYREVQLSKFGRQEFSFLEFICQEFSCLLRVQLSRAFLV